MNIIPSIDFLFLFLQREERNMATSETSMKKANIDLTLKVEQQVRVLAINFQSLSNQYIFRDILLSIDSFTFFFEVNRPTICLLLLLLLLLILLIVTCIIRLQN
jgi:hypothetical protein